MIHATPANHVTALLVLYLLLAVLLVLLQNSELFKYLLISNELKSLGRFDIQIRDMAALERMSNMDILCIDKTGVLTTRQMDVKSVYLADGMVNADNTAGTDENTFHRINIACALCNDVLFFEKLDLANLIDRALISFALKKGVDVRKLMQKSKRLYDKPFDSENRYMICGFELEGREYYFVKGDPGVILRMCRRYVSATGDVKKMDNKFWDSHLSNMEAINQSGDIVIALAYASDHPDTAAAEYTFLCLLQLQNSIQPGVCETIAGITKRGIRSMLLTGDRAETAAKVAVDCDITDDETMVLTGSTIQRMETREVARQSAYCSVFARLIPSQKGFLIRLLQQNGHCVGMVGDGVNDGIALRVADIGVSFVKNSSPIARKYSKILIKNFVDLERLMESTDRLKRRLKYSNVFRVSAIAMLMLGVYAWVFVAQSFGR